MSAGTWSPGGSHRAATVPAFRRAKIVCTLGPAVANRDVIESLVEAGMDVARLNFSHGDHRDHARLCRWVREVAETTGRSVGVLADLQGPKIRLGAFETGPVVWVPGEEVVITTESTSGNHDRVSTGYEGLATDVGTGDQMLVDDGKIALRVQRVDGPEVTCLVTEGGVVSDHKGITLPGVDLGISALSDKDTADLRFALRIGVDMVALSFVRRPEDADLVRRLMRAEGTVVGVLAKIEKPEAVAALDGVVDAFDGIMIARGDLGVEIPLEEVPLVQKRGVRLARQAGKPVIVATQMLDSMVAHNRPTRAEVSDVANAILDGADALMLSAETSVGAHPQAAVETMARIVIAAEQDGLEDLPPVNPPMVTRSAALARAATQVATDVGACALVAFTESGATARRLARHRPRTPLLAFTPHRVVRDQLALTWGVETFIAPSVASTDQMVRQAEGGVLDQGRGCLGDRVVIVAGTPPGQSGSTNMLRVHRLGDPLQPSWL
ncbi:MAG: pyruvate kinase [Acidimicrobiales bacterium]